MEVACGYVLEVSQAREWAEMFFHNMEWNTSQYRLPIDIRERLNVFYNNQDEVRCLAFWWKESTEDDNSTGILFPTDWITDHNYLTRPKPLRFMETTNALAVKKALFEPVMDRLSYLKSIRFVTVYDPQNTN